MSDQDTGSINPVDHVVEREEPRLTVEVGGGDLVNRADDVVGWHHHHRRFLI
jgi:hypothetical protein